MSRGVAVPTLLLLLAVRALPAQQVALETEPAAPARGALIRLRVTPTGADPVTGLDGVVADEPLHFARRDTLSWVALAGVPVEGDDSLSILLVLHHGERRDTVRTTIAVTHGDYDSERLRVAPSMAEPDSLAQLRIAREIAQARSVSRAAQHSPRVWESPFLLPRPTRITSRYGTAREYNGKQVSRHLGTDFSGKVGTPVRATNAGRVALVARFYLAGNVVYLDHGEGLISAYFHLSKTLVKQGDLVTKGQVIGQVGQTGRVTGPHLHWVMRYGGVTIDPMSVMQLLGSTTE
jgi:murein DD-endopeptidase MepM/ murein hydrolase activator NlpD